MSVSEHESVPLEIPSVNTQSDGGLEVLHDCHEGGSLQKLRDAYFKPRGLESPRLYEMLGVRSFKKWTPGSGDRAIRRQRARGDVTIIGGLPSNGSMQEKLKAIQVSTRELEAIHVGGLAVSAAGTFGGYEFIAHSPIWFAAAALNVAVNAYPIMVQRYNRLRVSGLLERISQHHEANT